jgi:putative Holliday junction resolvase
MDNSDECRNSRPLSGRPEQGAVLAIDPGTKRVGLALCRPGQKVAIGIATFHAGHGRSLIKHLRHLQEEYGVSRIVVGHPRNMDGSSGSAAMGAESLARRLRRELGLPVELWDERLTTSAGRHVLQGTGAPREARDRIAATLILQSWLDRQEGKNL